MEVSHIDQLLERYLGLLDEYTTLRESLNKAQAAMYQNLARANFTAERGIRYGQDFYDERMQASRTLTIKRQDDRSPPCFEAAAAAAAAPRVKNDSVVEAEEASSIPAGNQHDKDEEPPQEAAGETKSTKPKHRDPIHWYGILAPMSLRQAQSQAVHAVQDIIPRLVSVNAEMEHVEIEIRRARKKRAKAETAASAATADKDDGGKESRASRAPVPSAEAAPTPVETTS